MTIIDSQIYLYNLNRCESVEDIDTKTANNIKVFKRRFWMLALFSTLSMLSAMLYPQFVSMANVTMCFYGVSANAVNWTCYIYMVMYPFLVFPVSWLMKNVGLRVTILLGSLANTIGK